MADWFADNAPKKAASGDWFADNSPKGAPPASEAPKTWSQKLGLQNPIAQGVTDAAEGAASGLASTIYHAADPLNRAFGLERKISTPGAQQAMTAPPTTAGSIGRGVEQAAEFLAPAGLVGKGAKAIETAATGMKYAPVIKAVGQAALEGLGASAVAGAQTGGDRKAMRNAGLASAGTSAVLSAAGKMLPRVAAEVAGKTTGVGATPIKKAANASADLIEQMRHPDEMDVISHLKDAAQAARDSRAAEYSAHLGQIAGANHPPINPGGLVQSLDNRLAQFRVGRLPTGELDFSASPMGDVGQEIIGKADGLVRGWKDWSPLGADSLKRRLGELYSENGQARAFVNGLRDDTAKTIEAAVPQYQQMTSGYSKASQFLDQLRDLSLDSKNPGTAVRKITNILNQNNTYREGLIEALEPFTKVDLTGELAGLSLSKFGPRGLAGPMSGAGLLTAIATHAISPAAAVATALASPRLVGELAVAMGKASPLLSKAAAKTLPAAAAYSAMPPPSMPSRMPPPGAQR